MCRSPRFSPTQFAYGLVLFKFSFTLKMVLIHSSHFISGTFVQLYTSFIVPGSSTTWDALGLGVGVS